MNILITGANGFVGSYFISHYETKYNIKTFSFLNNDFSNLDLKTTDTIIHLSALVHQMGGASKEEYFKVNVKQTIDLAKKAKENGVKHFVFMSTVAVYGVEVGVIDKNTKCNPITEYGKSKFEAEQQLLKIEDEYFKVSIVRPPIVNGYKAPGNMKSLISLVNKVSILPFGGIKNRRSMIYVGNLAFYMQNIIDKHLGGIFLVADERQLSTTELIELIVKALDKKVYLIRMPFFESLLKVVKSSFHKRLFESLEVENSDTKQRVFGKVETLLPKSGVLPYSVEDGVELMIKGEMR